MENSQHREWNHYHNARRIATISLTWLRSWPQTLAVRKLLFRETSLGLQSSRPAEQSTWSESFSSNLTVNFSGRKQSRDGGNIWCCRNHPLGSRYLAPSRRGGSHHPLPSSQYVPLQSTNIVRIDLSYTCTILYPTVMEVIEIIFISFYF